MLLTTATVFNKRMSHILPCWGQQKIRYLGSLEQGDQLSVFSTKKSFIVIDSNRLVLPDPVVFRVSFDLLLFRGGRRSVWLFSRNVKTRVKNVIMLETNRQARAGMQADKLSYWHKL